jgi:chromate transporter
MVAVLFEMGKDTLTDWRGIIIALVSIALTFGTKKINAMWTVVGGAALGYLLNLI